MTAKKSQKSKKKINPLTEILLQINANPMGMPVCAPTKLKEEVAAVKYSVSGKLSAKDKLQKLEIFDYLEQAEERQFEIVQKKKLTQIPIKYYKLSSRGQAHLKEYYTKLEQERLEKLSSLSGVEEVIRENSMASKDLATSLQQINTTPQTIAIDVRQRMVVEINKAHNQFREMLQSAQTSVDKTFKLVQDHFQKIEEHLSNQTNQIEQHLSNLVNDKFQQNLEQCFVSYHQNINSLGQQLNKHIKTETSLTNVLEQKLALEKQKILAKSDVVQPNSKPQITPQNLEQEVVGHILSVLSCEYLEEIPEIYKKVEKRGVKISAGHFNDILWKLAQEEKIRLKEWDGSLAYLEQPQHAILRKQIFFYAIRLAKE